MNDGADFAALIERQNSQLQHSLGSLFSVSGLCMRHSRQTEQTKNRYLCARLDCQQQETPPSTCPNDHSPNVQNILEWPAAQMLERWLALLDIAADSYRFEQALSADGGKTWRRYFTAQVTRAAN